MDELGELEIEIVEHDPAWRQEFEQARSMILDAARGRLREVEHIGSTAVANLPARPILDIAARLDADLIEETTWRLLGLNYGRAEAALQLDGTLVLQKPRRGPATHHLYLAFAEGAWASLLAVRDQLVTNADEQRRFRLEKSLASANLDALRYREAKARFFSALLDRAAC